MVNYQKQFMRALNINFSFWVDPVNSIVDTASTWCLEFKYKSSIRTPMWLSMYERRYMYERRPYEGWTTPPGVWTLIRSDRNALGGGVKGKFLRISPFFDLGTIGREGGSSRTNLGSKICTLRKTLYFCEFYQRILTQETMFLKLKSSIILNELIFLKLLVEKL